MTAEAHRDTEAYNGRCLRREDIISSQLNRKVDTIKSGRRKVKSVGVKSNWQCQLKANKTFESH